MSSSSPYITDDDRYKLVNPHAWKLVTEASQIPYLQCGCVVVIKHRDTHKFTGFIGATPRHAYFGNLVRKRVSFEDPQDAVDYVTSKLVEETEFVLCFSPGGGYYVRHKKQPVQGLDESLLGYLKMCVRQKLNKDKKGLKKDPIPVGVQERVAQGEAALVYLNSVSPEPAEE